MTRTHNINGEIRTAVFSDCEKYRYSLEITWRGLLDDELRLMQVIGLNPSTATELGDDPTIRRCKAFAKREGCNGLVMTNLFAWRDTKPENMKKAERPIGEPYKVTGAGGGGFKYDDVNTNALVDTSLRCRVIVAAWGNHGAFLNRGKTVAFLLSEKLMHFRKTKMNEPEHPLYMPANQPLIPFSNVIPSSDQSASHPQR